MENEEKRMRYIYCITNLVNGKNYFGQRTVSTKCTNLLSDLYWGSGKYLKNAQKKYGIENFKKEIIIFGEFTKEEINRFEKCAIRINRFLGKAEYNLADGGDGGDLSKFIDYKKQARKISEWYKSHPELHKKAVEKAKQTRKKKGINLSLNFKGKHHSDETKKKQSDAKKGKRLGKENPSFGKHWFTNGIENIKCEICPKGFRPGRTASESQVGSKNPAFGTHWFTNGVKNVKARTCPEGFWRGRQLGIIQ